MKQIIKKCQQKLLMVDYEDNVMWCCLFCVKCLRIKENCQSASEELK